MKLLSIVASLFFLISCGDGQRPIRQSKSCWSKEVLEGVEIHCGDSITHLKHGSKLTPVVPCPDLPGEHPEVLMCIDETLYGVYFEGDPSETHYSQYVPGDYTTSDGRFCNFTVTNNCQLSY